MKRNEVERAVREARRYMKGKVNADNIIKYIQSKGYVVLFYNPEEEHSMLKMYELTDFAKTVVGFTIVQHHERSVFINQEKDFYTQFQTLAHEAGHVTLKHVEGDKIRNKAKEEMQAETFAYMLLNGRRNLFSRLVIRIKDSLMPRSVALYE